MFIQLVNNTGIYWCAHFRKSISECKMFVLERHLTSSFRSNAPNLMYYKYSPPTARFILINNHGWTSVFGQLPSTGPIYRRNLKLTVMASKFGADVTTYWRYLGSRLQALEHNL